MSSALEEKQFGSVASLHLHPTEPGTPMQTVLSIEVAAGKGIVGNPRYFERVHSGSGVPSRRQLSLIEREQIAEHAATLGMIKIPPGAVRSNIETFGLDLVALVGRRVKIGSAILRFYEPRKPCSKMDAICTGLKALMEPNRQGVMAEVLQSGRINAGDIITLVNDETPA